VDLDIIAGPGDVANDSAERKAAQIAVSEPRELRGVRADVRRGGITLISVEDGAQLARELRLELVFWTGASHSGNVRRRDARAIIIS
jgi:hypothetical protein